jgi:hypothetical protein
MDVDASAFVEARFPPPALLRRIFCILARPPAAIPNRNNHPGEEELPRSRKERKGRQQ